MIKRFSVRAGSLVGVLALSAVCLAACSSSSSSSSSGTAAANASRVADIPQTLTVGQISTSVAFFPIYVAREKGFFADHHLTVPQPPLLGTGAKVAAALVGGSIDVGAGVMTDAFNLYNAGQKPRLIADLVNSYYVDIVVGNGFSGPPSNASLLARIKALAGKKIGITGPGSGTQALVDYLFHLAGLNASTAATLVNLGANNTAAIDALKTHEVDALAFFQPVGQLAEALGVGSIYISPARGDVPQLNGATNGTVYTTPSRIAAKKQAILDFIAGLNQAEQYIHSASAASIVNLLQAYDSGMSAAVATSLVSVLRSEIPSSPAFNRAGYKAEVVANVQGGLAPSAPPYSTLVDTSLITSAIG
ncbi:MAG: ABC transporter substrate-binding protein [Actinomycetota bacterium]|nr:ABC transporter substrate-binding protein [Actinomycetota bacterium]